MDNRKHRDYYRIILDVGLLFVVLQVVGRQTWFHLLLDPNGLRFENVYTGLFSKSLSQPKYIFLEKVLADIPVVGYYNFSENKEVIHPNDVKLRSVMIFDDIACERQNNIRNYFAMGRHNDRCFSFMSNIQQNSKTINSRQCKRSSYILSRRAW